MTILYLIMSLVLIIGLEVDDIPSAGHDPPWETKPSTNKDRLAWTEYGFGLLAWFCDGFPVNINPKAP